MTKLRIIGAVALAVLMTAPDAVAQRQRRRRGCQRWHARSGGRRNGRRGIGGELLAPKSVS